MAEACSSPSRLSRHAEHALYDVKNTTAIRSLVGKGVKLRPLPRDVMDAYKTTFELYAEYSAKQPAWAKIYPGWKKFRDESFEWFRVAEYSYDSYMYSAQASGNNGLLIGRCDTGRSFPRSKNQCATTGGEYR